MSAIKSVALFAVLCILITAGFVYFAGAASNNYTIEGDDTIQEKGQTEGGQQDMPLSDDIDEEGAGPDSTIQEKGLTEAGEQDMPLEDDADEEGAGPDDTVQEKGITDSPNQYFKHGT
jgi:hypothetical protein